MRFVHFAETFLSRAGAQKICSKIAPAMQKKTGGVGRFSSYNNSRILGSNPLEKYESKLNISPNSVENEKYLRPPL